ncbi:MAG: TlpA disulfide reductase family protein [Pseudomonadota bacterium]
MKSFISTTLSSLLFVSVFFSFYSNTQAKTTEIVAIAKNVDQIPAFTLADLDGKRHQLDEWQGKIILLNFWASWCAPCLHEIKDLVSYQQQYANNNFQVLSIAVDDEKGIRKVKAELKINYPILLANVKLESSLKLFAQWANKKAHIPYSYVIDREGNIVFTYRGMFKQKHFDQHVLPLLKM